VSQEDRLEQLEVNSFKPEQIGLTSLLGEGSQLHRFSRAVSNPPWVWEIDPFELHLLFCCAAPLLQQSSLWPPGAQGLGMHLRSLCIAAAHSALRVGWARLGVPPWLASIHGSSPPMSALARHLGPLQSARVLLP